MRVYSTKTESLLYRQQYHLCKKNIPSSVIQQKFSARKGTVCKKMRAPTILCVIERAVRTQSILVAQNLLSVN